MNRPPLGDLGIDPWPVWLARSCEAALIALIAAVAILAACTFGAAAKPPPGITIDPEVAAWFGALYNPKVGLTCCDPGDSREIDARNVRITPTGYRFVDPWTGAWRDVPPEAILERVDNPTGNFVVSIYQDRVICFVRPAGA